MATVSMLMGRNLTGAEESRLWQLDGSLAGLFHSAGKAVRVCEGYQDGAFRRVRFIEGLVGPAVASVSSETFVTGTDQEVLSRLEEQLRAA